GVIYFVFGKQLVVHRDGKPEVRDQRRRSGERRIGNTDNVKNAIAYADGFSNDVRVISKKPLPSGDGQHGDGVAARHNVVVGKDRTSHDGASAEQCEIIAGDDSGLSAQRARLKHGQTLFNVRVGSGEDVVVFGERAIVGECPAAVVKRLA